MLARDRTHFYARSPQLPVATFPASKTVSSAATTLQASVLQASLTLSTVLAGVPQHEASSSHAMRA